MPLQGGLSVERMCQLSQVSRASFYRYLRRGWQAEEEMALRSAVQSVVIQHRWRYGYRRVTVELRTQGMVANHKRIARIMREDNLLTVRELWFQPPGHSLRVARVHLNLAGRMTLSGPNQLWSADITYVRLTREFVYLAVVLDVFSRKVIGWALGKRLKAQLPLSALEQAIADRKPPPGVVHHSDQGVQYASLEYMQKLRDHRMLPSMSRPGNPYDNATCESFLKTIKREEIYASEYRDFEDLRQKVEEFIDRYYNRSRLHSALGYCSPEEFENRRKTQSGAPLAGVITFFGDRM
jgi:putative transposase